MHYDAGAALEVFTPPTFIATDGTRHVGRHLGFLEWLSFMGELEAAAAKKLTVLRLLILYRRLCDAWFPPPPRRWGLLGPRPGVRVANLMAALPLAAQTEAIGTFLRSQARALGLPAPPFGSIGPKEARTTPKDPTSLTPIPATGPATSGRP